ncbi:5-valerolactone hydrolase [Novosphingobium sp. Fuku2-ISO-50]|nr:5-valerolactone hydrolase [Novosphingobium sp. Fuku2-ISO-50]
MMPCLADITFLGAGLNRPECVLTAASGAVYASCWTRGITRAPDGSVTPAIGPKVIAQGFLPNGFALCRDGSFIFANLGERGGIWRVKGDDDPVAVLTEVDGRTVPPANFVLIDSQDRLWITVSAASRGHRHFTRNAVEGFIALIDRKGARIVADGLVWTNEVRVSPNGRHLFVNETFACRTTRFDLDPDGVLSNRIAINYPEGSFPDGMAFDAQGNLWSVCIVSNRLIRLTPDGAWQIVLEDCDSGKFQMARAAFARNELTRDLIVNASGTRLRNLTSLAFGGNDMRTLYMGSLGDNRIASLRMPVAGLRPVHWDWG